MAPPPPAPLRPHAGLPRSAAAAHPAAPRQPTTCDRSLSRPGVRWARPPSRSSGDRHPLRVAPGPCRTGTPRASQSRANSVSYERYRWRQMGATTESSNLPYQEVTNATGRVFRVGEEPRDILGHGRWVPIMAAWVAMMLAGLLEYTWGALNPSLEAVHHWGPAPVFWAFS